MKQWVTTVDQSFSSPLVGDGCGALASKASLGGAGWGVPPHETLTWSTANVRLAELDARSLSSIVRRHPPSQPSLTRGEGAQRRIMEARP